MFIPEDFVAAEDARWMVVTQWKGLRGGSPPIAIEVKRDSLRLGGARTNAGLIPGDGDLGPITRGEWTELTIGMRLSADEQEGWVEVWRDGNIALQRTPVATMDAIDGAADPLYLKQGIYRDEVWNTTHVLYFSRTEVSAPASVD
jgi:hypothetical protein